MDQTVLEMEGILCERKLRRIDLEQKGMCVADSCAQRRGLSS